MTAIKRYIDGQWTTVVVGRQGDPGIFWRGLWSSTLEYGPTDAVFYDGSSWICTAINTNQEPSTESAFWDLLVSGGGGGSGNAISNVDIEYRESGFLEEGLDTVIGNTGPTHVYGIDSGDIGKALVVQRVDPSDDSITPGADSLLIVIRAGVGNVGDRVEVAYTPAQISSFDNETSLLEVFSLLNTTLEGFIYPFYFEYEDEEVVGGSLILGDAVTVALAEPGALKWETASTARLTKILTLDTDVGGLFDDPIPIDVWTAEMSLNPIITFEVPE
jgi:hypothetical protein